MPDRRVVKANHHAVPLLLDIAESTTSLYDEAGQAYAALFEKLEFGSEDLDVTGTEFFIGFEDHTPFGFVGLTKIEDCGELIGPYLYREYLRRDYGDFLAEYAIDVARTRELRILIVLVRTSSYKLIDFFARNDFDVVSDETDFIKRWRDGILEEMEIAEGTSLLVQILGSED